MGKSKKRIFNNQKNGSSINIKRVDAVNTVVESIKNNILDVETKNLISLFGISAEELAESGATYEELMAIKGLL